MKWANVGKQVGSSCLLASLALEPDGPPPGDSLEEIDGREAHLSSHRMLSITAGGPFLPRSSSCAQVSFRDRRSRRLLRG
jgi:hypothetical protein